jgi:hypothetical protein
MQVRFLQLTPKQKGGGFALKISEKYLDLTITDSFVDILEGT